MTAFAKQAIVEICASEGLALECFQESELLVNITKHVLVPQHKVLTKEVRAAALPPSDVAAPRDAPARLCVAGEIHPTEAVQAEGCAAASDPAQRPRGEILRAKPWPGGQDRATQRDGRQIRHLPFGRLAASARPLARSLLFSSLCCLSRVVWALGAGAGSASSLDLPPTPPLNARSFRVSLPGALLARHAVPASRSAGAACVHIRCGSCTAPAQRHLQLRRGALREGWMRCHAAIAAMHRRWRRCTRLPLRVLLSHGCGALNDATAFRLSVPATARHA